MGVWIHYYDEISDKQYKLWIDVAQEWDEEAERWVECENDPHDGEEDSEGDE